MGISDHNTVLLVPTYKTVLKREKAQVIKRKDWSEDATLHLKGCMECTDWTVVMDSGLDIDELTDVICSYVTFCEDMLIPVKSFKKFPNSKPWVTKSLKILLSKRHRAFKEGDTVEYFRLKKEIKCEIKRAKSAYKKDLEVKLKKGNLGSAWEGMYLITGQDSWKSKNRISLNGFSSDADLSQDFNNFYLRFDAYDFKEEIDGLKNECKINGEDDCVFFNVSDVITVFKQCKIRKAPGPDKIGGRLLKECAEQLGPIFYDFFLLCLFNNKKYLHCGRSLL